jgi:hypothetical protein
MSEMFTKRLTVAIVLALLPMVAVVPAVSAGNSWCDEDPIVVIQTPGGNLVPLYNTMGVEGLDNAAYIALANVAYTAQPANGGKSTLVKLEVTIPNGLLGSSFATRAKISTGPMGTLDVLAGTNGNSGKPMKLQFTLDVS